MKAISISIAALALALVGMMLAHASAAPPAANHEWLGVATNPPPAKAPVDLSVKGRERYQYEHGRWWYRLPDGHWVLWNGKQWIDAKPTVGAAPEGRSALAGLEPTLSDDLARARSRLAEDQSLGRRLSALDAARSAQTPTFPEPGYVQNYWLRSYNYNPGVYGSGPGPGAYLSPFYRHTIFPAPVAPFNYGTFGPYSGGALTGGMANGFLGRFP